MAQSVVGLDISSRYLLAAEIGGAAGKHPILLRAHRVPLPPDASRDGEVSEVGAVADALQLLWREGGFRSKRVVLGVGSHRVLVREHTVPVMPPAQLKQALPYQVADLLPVPVDETILDFYPIAPIEGSAPPEARGLLVAALKEAVETNVAALQLAGLGVAEVDLSAFAMVRALAPGGVLNGTHTLVAVGARTTHIVVAQNDVPLFVRIIPAGGETMTDALEPLTNESRATMELVKHKLGLDGVSHEKFGSLSRAMYEAVRPLIVSIRSTISYYNGLENSAPVESVIMLGTDSRVPGLARAVAENVRLPVRMVSPLEGLALGPGLAADSLGKFTLDLATPIGLALGSV